MNTWTPPIRVPNIGFGLGLKAGAVVLTLVLGLAFTLANAEAALHEYGDGVATTGGVDGDPNDVLGAADGVIVQIGIDEGGGSVTVSYIDNVAYNGPGADLVIHTLDEDFPATATIEVSADGVTFVSAGDFSDDAGNIPIDLGALGLPFGSAIRITHVSGDLPGFDLDAVEALNVIDLGAVEIVLDPPTGENPGFTEHTVTANVDDGAPVAGVLVAFAVVDGPNDDSSIAPTDELGDAPFTWIGDEGPGLDVVEAWLDLDGSGTRDEGEPFATATKQWHGVTGS
ncbi:MAG: hypothetical protein HOH95_04250, partial [Dehalococcoidia bacterium]|nr:hypothetical protein [Dehalococcoidia bacterium]